MISKKNPNPFRYFWRNLEYPRHKFSGPSNYGIDYVVLGVFHRLYDVSYNKKLWHINDKNLRDFKKGSYR